MIDIDIEVDTKSAALFIRGVNLKAVPIAETRALNKVIITVRKEAVSEIHAVRRLKKTAIRKQLILQRASKGRPEARVKASRRGIPLKEYSAKMAGRKGSKRVVINITGQRKRLDHAFIIDKIGGHSVGHVFERVGPSPLPIKKLFGPSLGSALVKPATQIALRRVVANRWEPVFTREMNYALSKLNKRRR